MITPETCIYLREELQESLLDILCYASEEHAHAPVWALAGITTGPLVRLSLCVRIEGVKEVYGAYPSPPTTPETLQIVKNILESVTKLPIQVVE